MKYSKERKAIFAGLAELYRQLMELDKVEGKRFTDSEFKYEMYLQRSKVGEFI